MKKVHKYKKVTSNNKIRERIFDNPPCKFGSQFTPLQTGSNIRHCSDGSLGNDLFLMQKLSMLYYQLWASRTSSGRTFAGAHNRHSSTFPKFDPIHTLTPAIYANIVD
jgi:hypothetical protein